jgi:N-acetylglutamate synthase-like GNAT family acetyltransferase
MAVAVDPALQDKKIGGKLFELEIQLAREKGFRYLTALSANKRTEVLLIKAGGSMVAGIDVRNFVHEGIKPLALTEEPHEIMSIIAVPLQR